MKMNTSASPPSRSESSGNEWSQKYLKNDEAETSSSLLNRWYRLTAPEEPPPSASFALRETARRGRLASVIFFFLLIVMALVFTIGLRTANPIIEVVAIVVLSLTVICLFLNRRGFSTLAGLIVSLALNTALVLVITRSGNGQLSASSLGLFDLLVFVELLVASMLPVNWVFAAAVLNIAFIVFDLMHQARTPSFAVTMSTDAYPIILRPILLHGIVTLVLWLWIRNATNAIKRADRAEVIARLEHSLAEQAHAVAEEKRQLDVSIQQIMQTHIRVSRGDFSARVPLNEGATLWTIAVSLNNLLSRLQRLRQIETEYENLQPRIQRANQIENELLRTRNEIGILAQSLHEASNDPRRVNLPQRSGTLLDPLIFELDRFVSRKRYDSSELEQRNTSDLRNSAELRNSNNRGLYNNEEYYR